MRLERRDAASKTAMVLAPLAAVAVTLIACAALVVWAGAPIGRTYALLFEGAFGSRFALTETLTRATPLMFTGLAAGQQQDALLHAAQYATRAALHTMLKSHHMSLKLTRRRVQHRRTWINIDRCVFSAQPRSISDARRGQPDERHTNAADAAL